MEPKDKDLLLRTFEYSRENNVMLKKMRTSRRWGGFFRFVYWLILLGGSIWLYYFLEPYISNLIKLYNDLPIEDLKPL